MAECPECGGKRTKKLSMIAKQGSQTGSIKGVGVSTSGGIGVGGGTTRNKSALAKEAEFNSNDSPLSKVTAFIAAISFFVIGFMFDSWGIGFLTMIGLCILAAIFAALGGDAAHEKTENQRREEWEKTWMCLDCGEKWVK